MAALRLQASSSSLPSCTCESTATSFSTSPNQVSTSIFPSCKNSSISLSLLFVGDSLSLSRSSGFKHGSRVVSAFSSSATGSTAPEKAAELVDQQRPLTVGDVMTSRAIIVAKVSTTVDEALESLVQNRITGMPVVDEENKVVGVVSDYDMLALDSISGKQNPEKGLFPEASSTWKAFKEIQKLLIKTRGKTVGDVMTPSPLVVRPLTNLEDAARLLLDSRFRRLPVVDENGKLVGILTRGNVVQAALEMKKKLDAHEQKL